VDIKIIKVLKSDYLSHTQLNNYAVVVQSSIHGIMLVQERSEVVVSVGVVCFMFVMSPWLDVACVLCNNKLYTNNKL
jgi:hypothetical protein